MWGKFVVSIVSALAIAVMGGMIWMSPDTVYGNEVPGSPTNLKGESADGGIVLTWVKPADGGEVDGYRVLRRRPEQGEKKLMEYATVRGGGADTWADAGVEHAERYVYRVKAFNDAGVGSASNFVNLRWRQPLPGSPTSLKGESADGGVVLTWVKPADGGEVDGYRVLRRRPEQGEKKLMEYATVRGGGADTWADAGVEHAERYVYRVKAFNDAGVGSASNFVNLRWRQPLPGSPTNLNLTVTDAGMEMTWVAPSGTVTGYQVMRRRTQQGQETLLVHEEDTGSTVAEWIDTKVEDDEEYEYGVRALNQAGGGELSNLARSTWDGPEHATQEEQGESDESESDTTDLGLMIAIAIGHQPVPHGTESPVTISVSNFEDDTSYALNYDVRTRSGGRENDCNGKSMRKGGTAIDIATYDGYVETLTGRIADTCAVGEYMVRVSWRKGSEKTRNVVKHDFEVVEDGQSGATEPDPHLGELVAYIEPESGDARDHGPLIMGIATSPEFRPGVSSNVHVGIGGLEEDEDSATKDYVVSVLYVDEDHSMIDGCNEGTLGGSYVLSTVRENGRWNQDFTVLGSCINGSDPATFRIELLDGNNRLLLRKDVAVPGEGVPSKPTDD